MGLTGAFGETPEDRAESDAYWLEALSAAAATLVRHGLPAHTEPRIEASGPCDWTAGLGSFSTLHRLRRLAIRLALGEDALQLDEAFNTEAERRWFDGLVAEGGRNFHAEPAPGGEWFEHLVYHPDNEGFYLPVEFPHVLDVGEYSMVGSTHRLRAELIALRALLPGVDAEDVLAVEGWVAQLLLQACERSLACGAAIAFH